jgi:hypothetical protein
VGGDTEREKNNIKKQSKAPGETGVKQQQPTRPAGKPLLSISGGVRSGGSSGSSLKRGPRGLHSAEMLLYRR